MKRSPNGCGKRDRVNEWAKGTESTDAAKGTDSTDGSKSNGVLIAFLIKKCMFLYFFSV